jgi:Flp pilus assembly protein TadG
MARSRYARRGWNGRRERQQAQSMVEFSLLAPVFLIILFLTIDFARLAYAYAAVSWAAREAARVVSLQPQASSDCAALQTAEGTAQGFLLTADPNSRAGNSDPNSPGPPYAPSTPPAGQGYIYIWPAVATNTPPDSPANCVGTSARPIAAGVQDVAVQVKYRYLPLMPLISSFLPPITLTTISVVHTEY